MLIGHKKLPLKNIFDLTAASAGQVLLAVFPPKVRKVLVTCSKGLPRPPGSIMFFKILEPLGLNIYMLNNYLRL